MMNIAKINRMQSMIIYDTKNNFSECQNFQRLLLVCILHNQEY